MEIGIAISLLSHLIIYGNIAEAEYIHALMPEIHALMPESIAPSFSPACVCDAKNVWLQTIKTEHLHQSLFGV
jgi:hypothetical protein